MRETLGLGRNHCWFSIASRACAPAFVEINAEYTWIIAYAIAAQTTRGMRLFTGDSAMLNQKHRLCKILKRVLEQPEEPEPESVLECGLKYKGMSVFGVVSSQLEAAVHDADVIYFNCGISPLHELPLLLPPAESPDAWLHVEERLRSAIQQYKRDNPGSVLVYMTAHSIDSLKHTGKLALNEQLLIKRDQKTVDTCISLLAGAQPPYFRGADNTQQNMSSYCLDAAATSQSSMLLNQRVKGVLRRYA